MNVFKAYYYGESMVSTKFSQERIKKYQKAGYRVIGKNQHTGVEVCRWTKSRLTGGRNCYKGVYGVDSHRCLQMSPSLDFCTFSCVFCWRRFGPERNLASKEWDSPQEIVEGMIAAQKKLLSGFGGNEKVRNDIFKEALKPAHIAISLDGEPTLYPHLAGLIQEIRKRGMTSFLVTNGTVPGKLQELLDKKAQPDNIYISVYGTSEEEYKKVAQPFMGKPFGKVLESLKILKKFDKARRVFRMTLVREVNMDNPEGYAKLALEARPDFIEMKGYTWLGASRERLKINQMPKMDELERFSKVVETITGYTEKYRDEKSRVIILCRDEKTWKKSQDKIKEQKERFEKMMRRRV